MMYYAAIWYDFDIIVTDYTQLYPALKLLDPTILIAPPIFYQLIHNRFSAPAARTSRQKLVSPLLSLPLSRGFRKAIAQMGLQ